MGILTQISSKIDHLHSGEQWHITAQYLLISRADFQSLYIYLTKEAEKGTFSLAPVAEASPRLGGTSVTVIKH